MYIPIKEQFNINNMDFNNNSKKQAGVNIFNKNYKTIYDEIYEKMLNTKRIANDELN